MQKKIKRFQRLATIRKKDVSKEINNSNLLQNEITKNEGLICFTINEGIYEEYGFDKKIKQLKNENKWKEIEFFKSDYIASKDVNAWLGLYEVTK